MPINKSLLNNKQMSTPLTPQEKLLYGIQKKPIINNIPQSINTSPVIQNASFSLLPIDNQSRPLKQPLGNLNINQLVPEEPKPSTQDDSNFLASLIGQSAAMLGAGIRGGSLSNVAENFQEMRDRRERQKEQEDLAKKYTDPNSEESKKRRLVYKSALGIDIPENYSYTDLNDPIVLQSIKDKSMEMKYAQMPKQIGTVPTGIKPEKIKEPTEAERLSLGFAKRTESSDKMLSDLENKSLSGQGGFTPSNQFPFAPERLKSEERKNYEAAQKDFISAILRKESGAAISEDEFKRESEKYFPLPGDSEKNIAYKQLLRKQAINNLKTSANIKYVKDNETGETIEIDPFGNVLRRYK